MAYLRVLPLANGGFKSVDSAKRVMHASQHAYRTLFAGPSCTAPSVARGAVSRICGLNSV